LLAIEQPELHLHPRLQANLGDLFIEAGLGGPKHTVILETHSEHLILRILRRIRETSKGQPHEGRKITPDDVAVYYLGRQDGQTKLTRIDIDMNGEFVQPWPDDFFELDFYERFS
jgi:predicted ATPase